MRVSVNPCGVRVSAVFTSIFCFAFLLQLCAYPQQAIAEDSQSERWHSTFRPGHNLTVLGLAGQSSWRIRRTENIAGFSSSDVSAGLLIRYSFHINIFADTGFALGTSLSAFYHPENLAADQTPYAESFFSPGPVVAFPSLTIAGIQNLHKLVRLGLYLEYAAVYFPELRLTTLRGEDNEPVALQRSSVALIPDSWLFSAQLDYFASPVLAVTLLTGFRRLESGCLGGCHSSTFVNSIQFSQEMWFGGLGVTWLAGAFFDD